MAIETYTLRDLIDAAHAATGGAIDLNYTSMTATVNRALVRLSLAHPWSWRKRRFTVSFTPRTVISLTRASNVVTVECTDHGMNTGDIFYLYGSTATTDDFNGTFYVSTVVDEDNFTYVQSGANEAALTVDKFFRGFVSLPTDFMQMHSLRTIISSIRNIIPTTMDEIEWSRQNASYAGGDIWYAIAWTPQLDTDLTPMPRMELFPTPTSESNPALVGTYYRHIASLSADQDKPDIPPYAQLVLMQLVRCMARQWHEPASGETGPEWAMYAEMLAEAKRVDGTIQDNLGRVEGTAQKYLAPAFEGEQRFFPWGGISA